MMLRRYSLFLVIILNSPLAHALTLDGSALSLLWGLPFAGILLSIAICPLLIPRIWHRNYGKITFIWACLFLVPFTFTFGYSSTMRLLLHTLFSEFIPFILLLSSLFIVSSGILITGQFRSTPKLNVSLLFIGTVLASIMGTTGAAILMIRPVIKANQTRKHKAHIIIFFIFLVANIGGGLTPLGDPPLFLGFLHGISFLWVTTHMFMPVLVCSTILLFIFYVIDCYYAKRDAAEELLVTVSTHNQIKLYGKRNLFLLVGIVVNFLLSGVCRSTVSFSLFDTVLLLPNIIRDSVLILICITSMIITPKQIRNSNQFNWEPVVEVAKLFAGIFITIFPVLAMLKAGNNGVFSPITSLIYDSQGQPLNIMYFWLTGLLSAFLDNAPTYLVFFNLANATADTLMGSFSNTLLAISMGSVFMGALTYIGNAPNFMIKCIVTQQGITMPGFFGYMKWSGMILLPTFLLLTVLFF